MLAYVFVHQPIDGTDAAEYGVRLVAFHTALAAAPPGGFRGSWIWRVKAGPFGAAFEDWYLVEDWTALGALNTAGVTGSRKAPHDDVAPLAGRGVGAIYGLVSGEPTRPARFRMRIPKPPGVPYSGFESALREAVGPDGAIWKRQMVLGPDLEFLVNAPAAPVADTVHGDPIDVSTLHLVP
jgi:hypothetical protein